MRPRYDGRRRCCEVLTRQEEHPGPGLRAGRAPGPGGVPWDQRRRAHADRRPRRRSRRRPVDLDAGQRAAADTDDWPTSYSPGGPAARSSRTRSCWRQDGASVGIGMGQVNRVDSARLAVSRSGERAAGSVAASDAFFPFPDGLEVLIEAGVKAVVQPGGSVRDDPWSSPRPRLPASRCTSPAPATSSTNPRPQTLEW